MVTLGVDHDFLDSPSTLAQELYDAFQNGPLPVLSTEVTLASCRLRIGTPDGEVVTEVFGESVGAGSGQNLPPNCAWPVTKFSAFGGRANRGRWFLPGVNADQVDSAGNIVGSASSALSDGLGDFMADLADADFTPVILHSDSELTPTVILAMICGNKIYTRGTRVRS